jgi:DNA-binding NarL/FixJ family response regulator
MEPAEGLWQVAQLLGAAAGDSAAWAAALEGMVDLLRASHAMLVAQDIRSGAVTIAECARLDAGDFAAFLTPRAADLIEPYTLQLPTGRAALWSQLTPSSPFERSDFYNEVVRPAKGFYAVAARYPLPGCSGFVAVCRSQRRGDFGPEDAATLDRLSPFLTTSLELYHRLLGTRARCADFERVLDQLDEGVVLTDQAGRALFVNGVAQRLLTDGDGLRLTDRGLAATDTAATRRLRAALASAAAGACARQRFSIPRTVRRTPLLVTLMPVWQTDFALRGSDKPRVAVFVQELEAPVVVDRRAAAESFGLTPREVEVAALLAAGFEIREIATQLALGQATVRSHLVQVFKKTNTHSQPKLVLLMKGFGERREPFSQRAEVPTSAAGVALAALRQAIP